MSIELPSWDYRAELGRVHEDRYEQQCGPRLPVIGEVLRETRWAAFGLPAHKTSAVAKMVP